MPLRKGINFFLEKFLKPLIHLWWSLWGYKLSLSLHEEVFVKTSLNIIFCWYSGKGNDSEIVLNPVVTQDFSSWNSKVEILVLAAIIRWTWTSMKCIHALRQIFLHGKAQLFELWIDYVTTNAFSYQQRVRSYFLRQICWRLNFQFVSASLIKSR